LISKEEEESKQKEQPQPKSYFTEYLSKDSPPSKYLKEMGLVKFITFFDIWSVIKRMNAKKGSLEPQDLPLPFEYCNVEKKIVMLDEQWNEELSKKEPSIVTALLKCFKREIIILFIISFVQITIKINVYPLLGIIINTVTASNFGEEIDRSRMFFSAGTLAFAVTALALLNAWYWHFACIIAAGMRNTIIGFTYKKLQSVTLSSIQQINIGKIVNLLSNDVNELDKGGIYLVTMVLAPYTILLSGVTIWKYYGFTTVIGMLSLVGFLMFSNYLSKRTQHIRSDRSSITDARIKMTNELIECVRLIKMYAWEKAFKKSIQVLREREMAKLLILRMVEVIGASVSINSTQTSLIIMCIIYTSLGGMLSSEKLYTTLMLFSWISVWAMEFFNNGVMFISAIKVVKVRLESVLLVPDTIISQSSKPALMHRKINPFNSFDSPTSLHTSAVLFNHFSAWWKKDDTKPCLDNITLSLRPGQLTTVIGTIGSGKTSFLLSFLREIPVTQGGLRFEGKIAYVEQEPIIFSGTVKSNILFGQEYDDQLYKMVVRACNLKDDFKQFDNRDETLVGERGITLSGGQKARISLARALYSQSDIYLFDDPLSAVDSKVGRHLFNYAIKGEMLKDKVVVLVTHHLNYAKESSRVLLFAEGKIIGDGTFDELRVMENNLFSKFKEIEDEEEKRKSTHKNSTTMVKGQSEVVEQQNQEEKPDNNILKGESANSEMTFETYLKYLRENGNYLFFIGIMAIYLFNGVISIVFSRALGSWGQAHSDFVYQKETGQIPPDSEFSNASYIFQVILLLILITLCHSIKTILFAKFILTTNSLMHMRALKKLVKTKIHFFDQTPIGTILNRFSNDLGVLDTGNAILLPAVFDGVIFVGLRMMTLMLVTPALIIPVVAVLIASFKIKKYLEKPVMETKRIDLASRSPLYSDISATINGLLAIRVFSQSGNFLTRFCDLLYTNMRAFLYMDRTLKFFMVLMSTALDSLTVVGTFICILVASYTSFDTVLFGLALLIFQEIAGFGNWLIRITLLVDINMQSVERITKYYELEPEPPKNIRENDERLQRTQWPSKGEISFHNIYMKYRPELDFVLKGLTFNIKSGSKVGIVGRTGAGKSSIIQALFRLTQTESIPGSCIKIDGTDISTIGLNLLRNSLSIIPQTPVVFTGTIKRNLDPFGELQESDLWYALQEVNLKDNVNALEKKLDTDMTMSSSVFSAGQKQLICLARAILRKSKIILLDEATANVDIETDDFIQRKIMERFKDCTVVTIAHRLITIANYDKVLVMDKGAAVEYDSPYMLMVKSRGDNYISSNGIFASMVRNSGDNMSKKIFDIAKNKEYQHL